MTGTPAATPAIDVRNGLAWVADRLAARFPDDAATDNALKSIARGYSVHVLDWTEEGEELFQRLCAALPARRTGETRKGYADRLRDTIQGGVS